MHRLLHDPLIHVRRVRRWAFAWGAVLAAVGAFALLAALHEGDAPSWTAFDNISEIVAAALATVACAVRARRERASKSRHADREKAWIVWSLLAAGTAAWTVGQIGWTVYEVGFGVTPEAPSPLDAAFLAFPILTVMGLLVMVQTPAGRLSQLRGAAEALLIAGGFALSSWSLIIGSVIESSSDSAFSQAVNLAYPLLDAVALAGVFFVALRRRENPPAGLPLLALGIACVAVSDSAFWYLSSVDPHFPGISPLDTGWVAGFLLVGLAALRPGEPRGRWRRLASSKPMLALPALPALIGIVVVLVSWTDGGVRLATVLLAIMAAVLLSAIVLLVLVTYENHALTSDLESRVEQRTAELRSTERYYRALVQHSSDVVMVLEPDLSIRYVSDSMLDIFGFPPGELVGRDLTVFGRGAANTLTSTLDRAQYAAGHMISVEWEMTDATGRPRSAESMITDLLADPNVGAFVLNTRDVTDHVTLTDQLRHQAFHDSLTGLPNRALLADRAAQAFARSLRTGANVAVLVIDIDAFKLANDSFGHQTGDELLHAVAQRIQSVARAEDTVARIGGDEFVVLVDAVESEQDAVKLAERVHNSLRPKFALTETEYTVSASIGVAISPAAQTSFDQLLCDADVAMYAVKASGKNGVQVFRPSMHQEARERFRLQSELRDGLERDEFWLLYQPAYDVTGERLEGFEALVRWNHPRHGLVRPEKFIPLAEESGMIVPLGRWVLRNALQQLASWDGVAPGGEPLSIAVNVSAVQLKTPSLVADVQDALAQTGVSPSRLTLEITESSLVEDSRSVIEVLHALKELGVRLAIDDFGTGYASLSYLQNMPVDILKIDQAFIKSSDDNERGLELLQAIVSIGQTLSLQTVAEGIEQPDQLDVVRSMGCDLAQGYLLGRPLPVSEAERLIVDQAASEPAQDADEQVKPTHA